MAKVKHFEDLEVWQLGREICREVESFFLIRHWVKDIN